MKLFVMSIRDRGTDSFGIPMHTRAVQQGIRSFADAVNSPGENNMINQHPEDYDLYLLGEFDDATGRFQCVNDPQMVAVGKDLVRPV